MRLRTVEELVGAVQDDEWHSLPRWKRIPSLEAGGAGAGQAGAQHGRGAVRAGLRQAVTAVAHIVLRACCRHACPPLSHSWAHRLPHRSDGT